MAVRGVHEVGAYPRLLHFGIFLIETIEETAKPNEAHRERVFNEKAVVEVVTGVLTGGGRVTLRTKYAGSNATVDFAPMASHTGANVGSAPRAVDDFGTYLL